MAAKKPHMDRLAREGETGLARTCPPGMNPGTEVCMTAVMSYDPVQYFKGRGPLEALGRGIEMKKSEVAFRCNLVTVKGDTMADFSAGHITDEEARPLIQMLDKRLGAEEMTFHAGVSYRHLMVWRGGSDEVTTVPPHNIVGQNWKEHVPKGKGEAKLLQMLQDSRVLLDGHEVNRARKLKGKNPANMIWLWSPGRPPIVPDFAKKYGLSGAVITAVDIVRGLGVLAGLEQVKVPGATGYFDTNYKGKGDATVKALKTHDFVLVHVEAPDEAGHEGNTAEKVAAIERMDEFIVGPLLKAQPKLGDLSILLMPDHPTPITLKGHAEDAVPVALWRSTAPVAGPATYDEEAVKSGPIQLDEGWRLLDRFFQKS